MNFGCQVDFFQLPHHRQYLFGGRKVVGSLSPESTLSSEDENVLMLLDQRWEEIQQKDSKVLSSLELKKMINDLRNK